MLNYTVVGNARFARVGVQDRVLPEWWPMKRPTLQAVSYLLRHKELWPEDFEWHYDYWDNCAIELIKQTWGIEYDQIMPALEIGPYDYKAIFNGYWWWNKWLKIPVSAKAVANRIEAIRYNTFQSIYNYPLSA